MHYFDQLSLKKSPYFVIVEIGIVGNSKKNFSLLHLTGLWSRVYYTLLVCDLEFTTP